MAVLLPLFLFAGEHLLRKRSYLCIVWIAVLILMVFLGGGPETTLLFFAFAYLYFFIRVVSDAALRTVWRNCASSFALATVAGLALSMIVILPFAEYLPHSWNNHEPTHLGGSFRGVEHDKTVLAAFTYLFPLVFGAVDTIVPPYVTYGLRNYFGIVSFFLALLALGTAVSRKPVRNESFCAQTLFFAAAALFVVLKRFGIAVNWIGALPFFRLLDFPKYNELLLSVSIAILSGIGLHQLLRRNVSLHLRTIALAISFLLFPFALLRGSKALRKATLSRTLIRACRCWLSVLPSVC
ncbi:MAG TPA: hypothetical protein VKX25_15580 [Bryobacteraceae bacterium]|nr:hypothetical protein [Bryobacteraceae bacterium]